MKTWPAFCFAFSLMLALWFVYVAINIPEHDSRGFLVSFSALFLLWGLIFNEKSDS